MPETIPAPAAPPPISLVADRAAAPAARFVYDLYYLSSASSDAIGEGVIASMYVYLKAHGEL